MQVRKAPRFVQVNGSNANKENSSVDLLFLGSDGQHYAIELDPAVIAPTIAAATGHLNELSANRSDLPSQPITAKGIDLVMAPDGSVALQLVLQSELKLNILIQRDQASALFDLLDDLREMLSRNVQ